MNLQDQLSEIIQSIQYLIVESTLIVGAILLLIVGLTSWSGRLVKVVFGCTIGLAFFLNISNLAVGEILSRSILVTENSISFTSIFLVSGFLLLVYKRLETHAAEFYFFILSLLVASVFIMKSNSILLIFIAIELTSFVAYILTNFSFKRQGHEAGIKYLLFGAVSSAIMLLGFGMLYGSSEVFFISDLVLLSEGSLVQNVSLTLIISGLLFKSSIFPFHIWVPATYQEAPSDATAILSIVPKLGALILLGRIVTTMSSNDWIMDMCLVLGMVTIVVGVFSALKQSNARRMISIGAIAHSGFLLPLAVMSSGTAAQSFWWYASIYAVMNIAIFLILDWFEKEEIVRLKEYSGLGNRGALMGVAFSLVLVSLVGLPPLAGFTAKLFLFTSIWEEYIKNEEGIYMAYLIVGVFATVISLFFYLKIPYYLFLVSAKTSKSIEFSFSTKFIATLFSIVLLLLFFAPQILTVMQQLLSKTTP